MTTDRKITVTAWIDSQDPVLPPSRTSRRFLPPALFGLAGTLLLHCLALQTVVLGSRARKTPPEVQEPGSSNNQSAGKPAESLVFVDLSKTANADNLMVDALALARAAIIDTPIVVSPPDPPPLLTIEILALNDDQDSQLSADTGDGMERARLFGIYTGQIQARIKRIWRRPRTPVEEGSDSAKTVNSVDYFHCQVQVVQDSSGNVQEVLLPNCNGSVTWQRSLVLAIQQASPLPAPPSASVFSHSIGLNFLGLSYVAGSPEDDYEIAPVKTVQVLSTLPSSRPAN